MANFEEILILDGINIVFYSINSGVLTDLVQDRRATSSLQQVQFLQSIRLR